MPKTLSLSAWEIAAIEACVRTGLNAPAYYDQSSLKALYAKLVRANKIKLAVD